MFRRHNCIAINDNACPNKAAVKWTISAPETMDAVGFIRHCLIASPLTATLTRILRLSVTSISNGERPTRILVDMPGILLVEDDPFDVKLTTHEFKRSNVGKEITVGQDGTDALDYLERLGKFKNRHWDDPALILIDLPLPKMSDIELLKVIKSDAQLKSIPIILLSLSQDTSACQEYEKLGIVALMEKPISLRVYLSEVSRFGPSWIMLPVLTRSFAACPMSFR